MDASFDTNESNEPAEQSVGRFIGIAVFVTGIVLLVLAFVLAYRGFQNIDTILPLELLRQDPPPSPIHVYGPAILRLILIIAMGYLGSLIAARGAQFFFSAKKEARRVAAGD